MSEEILADMTAKELAWIAYRQAWNEKTTMSELTKLEERTARNHFEEWWSQNHE